MASSTVPSGELPREIFEDEHDAFRESVRGFLLREAVPHTEAWEEAGLVDRSFWTKAAAQGYVGFAATTELGGAGVEDFRFNAIINEEVAYTGTVYDNFSLTNDIVMPYLLELTTDEQRARWLPSVTSGETIVAIAMSEPGAGSDLRGIASTAAWRDGEWELNGSKTFVTNGILADLVIVAAQVRGRETEGLALFVVESDMPGFQRGRKLHKVGRRAQDTAELFFESMRVPAANLIGGEGKGFRCILDGMNAERILVSHESIGDARWFVRTASKYASERIVFDRPIGQNQGIQHPLAEKWMYLEAAWLMAMKAAELYDTGQPCGAEANSAKFLGARAGHEAAWQAIATHGGFGYAKEYHVERLFREVSLTRLAPITEQLILSFVAEKVLDLPKSY